ncbi:MAG: hypothetical protein ABFC38_05180 [Methanospirillum sp.]
MLAQFPELLLTGDDRTPYSKLLLIKREKGIPIEKDCSDVFSLDHLFIDQSGVPTLVEVKRRSDTRNRRELVAQMLDYAANGVVTWGGSRIREEFEETCRENGKDPEAILGEFLDDEMDAAAFWHRVQENLSADRIRMIFVADQISVEVKRIAEFLNRQMRDSEMIAIELRQFVGENVQAYVPDVIVKPDREVPSEWTRERFLDTLMETAGTGVVPVMERVLEWSASIDANEWYGKGTVRGACAPGYPVPNGGPMYPFHYYTNGKAEVQFKNLERLPPFDNLENRRELKDRLNEIKGIAIPDNGISSRQPFLLSVRIPEGRLDQFLDTLGWLIAEVKREQEGSGTPGGSS